MRARANVWAECESEGLGRKWLYGGCFDFSPPNNNLWGGRERQTDRERRKRNAVCSYTWSCRRKRVVGGIACVWNASKAFWLPAPSASMAILSKFCPFLVCLLSPLCRAPLNPSDLCYFSGRVAVYNPSCKVNKCTAALQERCLAAPAPLPNTQNTQATSP